jgi:hypothetical protein
MLGSTVTADLRLPRRLHRPVAACLAILFPREHAHAHPFSASF